MTAAVDRCWESLGTAIAGLGWVAIGAQVVGEFRRPGPSQLAPAYVLGFLLIFLFWTAYGWHYRRPAVWVGNLVASLLQAVLAAVVLFR